MKVLKVPLPVPGEGMILVQNHYSLISAGTEGSTVKAARKGLIGKAKDRPQQVKQMLDVLRRQGPVNAYHAVMKKLDAWSPLGYSCAGKVIDAAPDVSEFSPGNLAACGGLTASHAEVVAVPANLCVKLPAGADLRKAAFNSVGAIALQGVRQADLRLGETCAVIGLGLIGQLTCLLLKAGGVRVLGIDVDEQAVRIAERHCADMAVKRNAAGLEEMVEVFTEGLGVDAVIITAGTNSLDPINFAGRICRKKGKIVIVGNVPAGFDRDPHYYRKELDIRMSCSYGPGRYDPLYEEKGRDYPAGYVRWTEKRNMQAFQQCVHSGRINIDYLAAREFRLAEAPRAYEMILNKTEPCLGMLIRYDADAPLPSGPIRITTAGPSGKIGVAFIGAGSYAQSHLLPNLPGDASRRAVMTASGTSARSVAERFGFASCTSNADDIMTDGGINAVFIATRHDSHADYAVKAIQAGKHVFVEKPLCISGEEMDMVRDAYYAGSTQLMVGFNRRFSGPAGTLKKKMGTGPMAMLYRVNAGSIPADSWVQDLSRGGGRIIGEVCHFVDFLTFMNGSRPVEVFAAALSDYSKPRDTVTIQLSFENGAVGTIAYFANGSKSVPKERIEIYKGGMTGIIDDFRTVEIHGGQRTFREKLWRQDKGQKQMVAAFIEAVREGRSAPVAFDDIEAATRTTFAILESLRTKSPVRFNS